MDGQPSTNEQSLSHYLTVLVRRKWWVLVPLVVIAVAGTLYAAHKPDRYSATAEVLLSRQSVATDISATDSSPQASARISQTAASVARAPSLIQTVLHELGQPQTNVKQFLANSSVEADASTDLLQFSVMASTPGAALRGADAYARSYATFRSRLTSSALQPVIQELNMRINSLRRSAQTTSPTYIALVGQVQQLTTAEALDASSAVFAKSALDATKTQPKVARGAAVAIILGLVAGLALGLVRDISDTREHDDDELVAAIGLPLLGRLPAHEGAPAPHRIIMLEAPNSQEAEAFRLLRTNVEFARLGRPLKRIMVTSAHQGEGKSTTVANLAVALARGGASVGIVDLDLRRPTLHSFFSIERGPGISRVVVGDASLDDALVPIPLDRHSEGSSVEGHEPSLWVLPAGPEPPDIGEFVSLPALPELLERIGERFDYLLVDAPPMLAVGDPLKLSAAMDAVFVVARLHQVRRREIRELRRVLETAPTTKLGVVVTDVSASRAYGYYQYSSHSSDAARA